MLLEYALIIGIILFVINLVADEMIGSRKWILVIIGVILSIIAFYIQGIGWESPGIF